MATAEMSPATWSFDESSHCYMYGGVLVPSVTQALKAAGLISFEGIPFRVLEHKKNLGSLVHKATELFDNGEDLSDFEIPQECGPYVEGWANFRSDCGFQPELVEHQQIGEMHGMRYGMKLDALGDIYGVPHIIEKKCGSSESPVWGIQMVAYAVGIKRPAIARAAVQLGPQFPRKYKVFEYTDKSDVQVWASALALTLWMQNNRIGALEDIPERLIA